MIRTRRELDRAVNTFWRRSELQEDWIAHVNALIQLVEKTPGLQVVDLNGQPRIASSLQYTPKTWQSIAVWRNDIRNDKVINWNDQLQWSVPEFIYFLTHADAPTDLIQTIEPANNVQSTQRSNGQNGPVVQSVQRPQVQIVQPTQVQPIQRSNGQTVQRPNVQSAATVQPPEAVPAESKVTREMLQDAIVEATKPQRDPTTQQWTVGGEALVISDQTADQIIGQQARDFVNQSVLAQDIKKVFQIQVGKPPDLPALLNRTAGLLNKTLNQNVGQDKQPLVAHLSGMLEAFNYMLEGKNVNKVDPTSRSILQKTPIFTHFRYRERNLDLCQFCSTTKGADSTVRALSDTAPWRIISFPHAKNPTAEVCFDVLELKRRIDQVNANPNAPVGPQGQPRVSTSPAFEYGYFESAYFSADEIEYIQEWYTSYQVLLEEMKQRNLTNEQMINLRELGKRLLGTQAAFINNLEPLDNNDPDDGPAAPTDDELQDDLKESDTSPKSWSDWFWELRGYLTYPYQLISSWSKWIWNHPWALQFILFVVDIVRTCICYMSLNIVLSTQGVSTIGFGLGQLFLNQLVPTFLARAGIICLRLIAGKPISYLNRLAQWLYDICTSLGSTFAPIPFLSAGFYMMGGIIQVIPNTVSNKFWIGTGSIVSLLSVLGVGYLNPTLAPILFSGTNVAWDYLKQFGDWITFSGNFLDVWRGLQLSLSNQVYVDDIYKNAESSDISALAFQGPSLTQLGQGSLFVQHLLDPSTLTKIILLSGQSFCSFAAPRGATNALCVNSFRLIRKIMGAAWFAQTVTSAVLDLVYASTGNYQSVSCVRSLLPKPTTNQLDEDVARILSQSKEWSKEAPSQEKLEVIRTTYHVVDVKRMQINDTIQQAKKNPHLINFQLILNQQILKAQKSELAQQYDSLNSKLPQHVPRIGIEKGIWEQWTGSPYWLGFTEPLIHNVHEWLNQQDEQQAQRP